MKLHAFICDHELAGPEFSAPSWAAWRVIARLFDGDAHLLTDEERKLALRLTGRTTLPTKRPDVLVVGAGRRSGKSQFAGLTVSYLASEDHRKKLAPGEQATVVICGPDLEQAAIPFKRARGLIERSPTLKGAVVRETEDTLDFAHNSRVETVTSSFKTIRGRTLAGAVVDETAFLPSEGSALPDEKLFEAITPGLLTLSGRAVIISSPYVRAGLLHDLYARYFGNDRDDSGLFIQAASLDLNPTLDRAKIEEEERTNPESAASEYPGRFRNDSSCYLTEELISAAVVRERSSLPRLGRTPYFGFCDPSSGRNDSFTVSVAHQETGGRVVLDAIEAVVPPFDPAEAVKRCAGVLGHYGLSAVTGDRFAVGYVAAEFARHGIRYAESERSKSEVYRHALPLFTSKRVELLDHRQLLHELRLLEIRPQRGGGEKIDHPSRTFCHDDIANSAIGALLLAASGPIAGDYGHQGSNTRSNADYDPLTYDDDRSRQREPVDNRPPWMRPTIYE
jgi:hypothetical protein